jgi:hypothetical protein
MAAVEQQIVAHLVSKFASLCASRFSHCLVHWNILSGAYTCTSCFFIIHINIIVSFYVSVCGLFVDGFATFCYLLHIPSSVVSRSL